MFNFCPKKFIFWKFEANGWKGIPFDTAIRKNIPVLPAHAIKVNGGVYVKSFKEYDKFGTHDSELIFMLM